MEELSNIIYQWTGQGDQGIKGTLLSIPFYFLAGMVASLFPCVYPLYPITAAFLRNRATEGQSVWRHPLLYWIGTSLAYSLLGAIATASGGAFNQLMQSGIAVLLTGFLFLFLVFVCLDWFTLSWNFTGGWTQALANRSGSLMSLGMGAITGLVASACVAPVIISMLLVLIQNPHNASLLLQVIKGFVLCFCFGAGLGAPLFLTGILGARLPRSGSWQRVIKYGFAIGTVLAAVYQINKGLEIMQLESSQIYNIFIGLCLLFIAILLGLKPAETNDRRAVVRFYFALITLSFGLGLIIRGISFIPSLTNELSHKQLAKKNDSYEAIGSLRFYRDKDYALSLAEKKRLPIFIDFYAEWCANCKDFNRLVKKNQTLQNTLQKAILLKVYDTDSDFEYFQKDPQMKELQIGLPFFAVINSNEELLWKTTNYRDSKGMIQAIQKHSPQGKD